MPHLEPDINKFRKRLNDYRNDTLDRTAKKLGVGKRTYQDWINPHQEKWPSVDNLIKIANTYEATTDYILGISDYKTPEKDFVGKEIGLTDEAIDKLRQMKQADQTTALQIISDLLTAPDFDKIMTQFIELYSYAIAKQRMDVLKEMQKNLNIMVKHHGDDERTSEAVKYYLDEYEGIRDIVEHGSQFLKSTYADISRLSWNLAESLYQSKAGE